MMTRVLAGAALLACLAVPVRAGDRPWNRVRGHDITVVGQQSPKTLRGIAIEIEQFRLTLGAAIRAAQVPAMPTILYAFEDRKAMEPFVPLYHGKPAMLAGYCLCGGTADANLIVASLASYADSSAIIFHEYTHLLIRDAVHTVPVWLNEGIAEYYSTFRLSDAGRRAEIGRPIEQHVQLLRHAMIPLPELLAVDQSSPLYNEGDRRSIFYAESWALTHYLLTERPNGAAAVNKYVTDVAGGTPADAAFLDAFGETPDAMNSQLSQYVRRPAFKSTWYVLDQRIEVDEPESAQTLSPAEADAQLGRIQVRVNRAAEAAPRIEAAARAASDSAETQLALALLRLNEQRPSDARAPLEKAVALAPNDFVTQYLYGLLLLRDTIDAPRGTGDKLELAHAALTRAVAANPQSADALAWQAYADFAAGTRLDEAREETRRAIALAPGEQSYRRQLAAIEAASAEAASAERRAAAVRPPHPEAEPAPERRRAPPSLEVDLRPVQTGEERVLGDLLSIECGDEGIRFSVRVGSRVVVATAERMLDVELTSFVGTRNLTIGCGARTPPDRVYLTSKAGQAIAVEFLPRDYVP
jgi:tetratricopeptide (TPR) repeat protein